VYPIAGYVIKTLVKLISHDFLKAPFRICVIQCRKLHFTYACNYTLSSQDHKHSVDLNPLALLTEWPLSSWALICRSWPHLHMTGSRGNQLVACSCQVLWCTNQTINAGILKYFHSWRLVDYSWYSGSKGAHWSNKLRLAHPLIYITIHVFFCNM
jgi:hypothetical protein